MVSVIYSNSTGCFPRIDHRYLLKINGANFDWKFSHLSLHPSLNNVTESVLLDKNIFLFLTVLDF